MNAEKLFLNLGYTKHITEKKIKYYNQENEDYILFDLEHKSVKKYYLNNVDDDYVDEASSSITVIEFLAINKQIDELGWFKQLSPFDFMNLN